MAHFPHLPAHIDQSLIFEFFWSFSAFECALKRAGFSRKLRDGQVQADWHQFGEEVKDKFEAYSDTRFQTAVVRIKELNPKRQVLINGELGWENVLLKSGQPNPRDVLDLVKTVRNNLFHGGKYADGPSAKDVRDRELIETALTIIKGCYKLHQATAAFLDQAVA